MSEFIVTNSKGELLGTEIAPQKNVCIRYIPEQEETKHTVSIRVIPNKGEEKSVTIQTKKAVSAVLEEQLPEGTLVMSDEEEARTVSITQKKSSKLVWVVITLLIIGIGAGAGFVIGNILPTTALPF